MTRPWLQFAALVVCAVIASVSVPCALGIAECDKSTGTAAARASLLLPGAEI